MRQVLACAIVAVLAVVLSGCGKARPARPAGTGARQTAQAYLEALNRQDWARAYELLHPECRQRWTEPQFRQLAESRRQALGFTPLKVRVTVCQEQGDQAIAHVVLQGPADDGKSRDYKDAVLLRRHGDGWTCWLAEDFRG